MTKPTTEVDYSITYLPYLDTKKGAYCFFCKRLLEEFPDQFEFKVSDNIALVCTYCYPAVMEIVKSIMTGLFEILTFKE